MKNIIVVSLMASAAALSAFAAPVVISNYCESGAINEDLEVNTKDSGTLYTTGSTSCVVASGKMLTLSGEPLSFGRQDEVVPPAAMAEFKNSRISAYGALHLRAPNLDYMYNFVPWQVTVEGNTFEANAALHFHGCLPRYSRVIIKGNHFLSNTQRNLLIPNNKNIAAITLAVPDPDFTNPMFLHEFTEVTITENIISDLRNTVSAEASGIRIPSSSFFMANNTKLSITKNSVYGTGSPSIPSPITAFDFKGYINVVPEYKGRDNVTIDFVENNVKISRGIAWWLPGMWAISGADNLHINVLRNKGIVEGGTQNQLNYVAAQGLMNVSKGSFLNYEDNEITLSGGDGVMVFYDFGSLEGGQYVRFVNNKFNNTGPGAARMIFQPWRRLSNAEFTGNTVVSAGGDALLQFTNIYGANTEPGSRIDNNTVSGKSAELNSNGFELAGGFLKLSQTRMISKAQGRMAISLGYANVTGGGDLAIIQNSLQSQTGVLITLPNGAHADGPTSAFRIEENILTAAAGASSIHLNSTKATNGGSILVRSNVLSSTSNNPNILVGAVSAVDGAEVGVSDNNLYRRGTGPVNAPFIYADSLKLDTLAAVTVNYNVFDAVDQSGKVPLFFADGNVSMGTGSVRACGNRYYGEIDPVIVGGFVGPASIRDSNDCVGITAPNTTTTTTTTTTATTTTGTTTTGTTTPAPTEPTTTHKTAKPTTTWDCPNAAPTAAAAGGSALAGALFSLLLALLY